MGRTITPEDDDPKSNAVVNISYGIWQRVFGGRQDIIGKDVELNGQKAVIIGVMPKGFTFPPGEVDPPEVWTALQLGPPNAKTARFALFVSAGQVEAERHHAASAGRV